MGLFLQIYRAVPERHQCPETIGLHALPPTWIDRPQTFSVFRRFVLQRFDLLRMDPYKDCRLSFSLLLARWSPVGGASILVLLQFW